MVSTMNQQTPKVPVGYEEQVSDMKRTRLFLSCEGAGTKNNAPCMRVGDVLYVYRALTMKYVQNIRSHNSVPYAYL